MSHLSDEAVAAFADDVLRGHARERAKKHCAGCAECNHAVAVQREAVWALRAAPAPALSSDLLSRLRAVPSTTPIRQVPTTVDDDGTVMFASFGTAAAFVAPPPSENRRHWPRNPFVTTTAVVAAAAAITAGSAVALHDRSTPSQSHDVRTISHVEHPNRAQ